jgi:hypothetical protein
LNAIHKAQLVCCKGHKNKRELSKMEYSIKALKSIVLGVFLLVTTTANAAIILSAVPSTSNAAPGEIVHIDIVIDGLTAGAVDSLGAFDIEVGFDATALSVTSFSIGSLLGDFDFFEAFDDSFVDVDGIVNLAVLSFLFDAELDALQPASFVLATIIFSVDTLDVGSSTDIAFGSIVLSDAFGDFLIVSSSNIVTLTNPVSVAVNAPTTQALLLFSIISVFFNQRKTKN